MLQYVNTRVKSTGGTSWQVLDTADTVKLEISSTMQSITNIGANRSAIPKYLYSLSLEPRTISVVLQWNSDLVEKGLNLGSSSVTEVVKNYTTLNQLAPQQCSDILKKASELKWDETIRLLEGKDAFDGSLKSLADCTQYSSLAAFSVASWKNYLEARFSALGGESANGNFLNFIKTAITSMPEEDLGQQSSVLVPFEVTQKAFDLLQKNGDKDAFLTNLGHQFLESYTERASLDAVWHVHLPDGTPEDFYALRMTLQKYFLGPRTVPEVCGFLSAPKNLYDDFRPLPAVKVKVSIFGYRDEFTREPVDLNDLPSALARHYLTSDALWRNTNRETVTMRPWQGLHVKGFTPPDDHLAKNIPPVGPEEFFVLNTRKAERLLLLLKLYSKDPDSGIKPENLHQFGETLDRILDLSSLQKNTGSMVPERKQLLINLVRELEQTLPISDLERTPSVQRE